MEMMRRTGCDGVVIGRGCLGRPWLFRDPVEALNGRPVPASPTLGEACAVMHRHATLLLPHPPAGGDAFTRKHASWYLTGYPAGGDMRREFGMVSTIGELEDLIARVDPDTRIVEGGERDPPRSHQRPHPRCAAERLPRSPRRPHRPRRRRGHGAQRWLTACSRRGRLRPGGHRSCSPRVRRSRRAARAARPRVRDPLPTSTSRCATANRRSTMRSG